MSVKVSQHIYRTILDSFLLLQNTVLLMKYFGNCAFTYTFTCT